MNREKINEMQLLRSNISTLKELNHINPEDMELYEKDKKIIISFIDELSNKNAIKNYNSLEEEAFMDKVIERSNLTQKARHKLELIITSIDFQKFEENMKQFGFDHVNIMHIYANVLVQEILDAYELFKKYLMLYIDKKSFKLEGNEALGSVLLRFQKNKINHRFDECMDVKLRNALAHGSYWFSKDKFYYVEDPTFKRTKSITLREFGAKMGEVEVLCQAFGDNAQPYILQLRKRNEPTLDKDKNSGDEPVT